MLLVVALVGAFALIGLGGVILLLDSNHSPELIAPLVALVGPAIGAVSAFLVSTRSAPAADPAPDPAPPAAG